MTRAPERGADNLSDTITALMAERRRHTDLVNFWWKRAKRYELALMGLARSREPQASDAKAALEAEGVNVGD